MLAAAQKYRFSPDVYDDWRKMLDEVRPDLVCVDGPYEFHAEMAAYSLKRGSGVFCEKLLTDFSSSYERFLPCIPLFESSIAEKSKFHF